MTTADLGERDRLVSSAHLQGANTASNTTQGPIGNCDVDHIRKNPCRTNMKCTPIIHGVVKKKTKSKNLDARSTDH